MSHIWPLLHAQRGGQRVGQRRRAGVARAEQQLVERFGAAAIKDKTMGRSRIIFRLLDARCGARRSVLSGKLLPLGSCRVHENGQDGKRAKHPANGGPLDL